VKNDLYFGLGIFFIFIYFIILYVRKNKNKIKKETLDYDIMENLFFEKIKQGHIEHKLLKIYSSFDLMMIRSFFISENVPYYVEFEHLMKIYPFIHAANYNNLNQSHNIEYVSIFTNYILFPQQTTVSETAPWSATVDGYIVVVRIHEYS